MASPTLGANFGRPIAEVLDAEQKRLPHLNLQVPMIIEKSLAFLMEKGLNTEGLFRVPGSTPVVNKLRSLFDAGEGEKIDFLEEGQEEEMTADNIASTLKLYLREMPEPFFTAGMQGKFVELMAVADEAERIVHYRALLQQIPALNARVIKKLLNYLMQVSANSSTNMMHADNLSIVFGEMAGVFARQGKEIVTWLIDHYPLIYEAEDLQQATLPLFQRKLVGHLRSVVGVILDGDYIWSFDGMGAVRVWQRLDMQFYKAFSTNMQFISPPLVFDGKLLCLAPGVCKWCSTAEILVPGEVSMAKFKDLVLPPNSLLVVGISVGDEVWAAGDRVVTIDKELQVKELTTAHPQTIIQTIAQIGNQVWAIKGKTLQVFDASTKALLNEVTEPSFGDIKKICPIGGRIWLVGSSGIQGTIWVINKETFAVEKTIHKHKGAIYTAVQIGTLAWTCAWDCKIYTWNAETLEFVRPIPNLHRDAIREIVSIWKADLNGWQVWTGSSDRSINIVFVPAIYDQHLLPQTPEEAQAETRKDEEDEKRKEERKKKEAELAKKKRDEKEAVRRMSTGTGNQTAAAAAARAEKEGKKKEDDKLAKKEEEKKKKDEKKEEEKKKKDEKKKEKDSLKVIRKSSTKELRQSDKRAQKEMEELVKVTSANYGDSEAGKMEEKIVALWKAFDRDGSGELSSEEQDTFFASLYDAVSQQNKKTKKEKRAEVITLWKKFFDEDGNGVLSFEEFQDGIFFLRVADTPEKINLADELRKMTKQPQTSLHKKADPTERDLIVLDLFSNEKDTAAGLLLLDKIYRKTLLDEIQSNKKLQKLEKEFTALIDPIFRPYQMHSDLVLLLTMRLESASDRIGDIVKEKAKKFEVYTQPEVATFHQKNLSMWLGLIHNNPSLKEIFDDLEEVLYAVTSKKITYYFSLTLRRISRFTQRLGSLLEKTPEDHPDHADLLAAIEIFKTFDSAAALPSTVKSMLSEGKL